MIENEIYGKCGYCGRQRIVKTFGGKKKKEKFIFFNHLTPNIQPKEKRYELSRRLPKLVKAYHSRIA